jgi:uncharacterized membrane protein
MRETIEQQMSFERAAAAVLRAGLRISAALVAAGLAMKTASLEPTATRTLDAGLIVLMATPPTQVVVSLVKYARTRDWMFAAAALAVLLMLVASVVSAIATR